LKPRIVQVNAYSEKWVRRGFPWVYPKEVTAGQPRRGDEVVVRAPGGEALGRGIGDDGWIAVRIYAKPEVSLDAAWMSGVVRAASWRAEVLGDDTDAYRLIHGENDGLPGVRVDCWGPHRTVIADTPAVKPLLGLLTDALVQGGAASVCVSTRRDPRDADGREELRGVLYGEPPAQVVVRERGLRFVVRPDQGPDVGLYPDMREARAWLASRVGGRRVLNLFAYTGAFSVMAAANGAEVVTVDLSERYLAWAKENFAANGLAVHDDTFIAEDSFKALDRLRRRGEQFSLVIVDPPSFSHSDAGMFSVERDYVRLVAACARVVAPGGWLLAATNHGQTSPHQFQGFVEDGCRKAGREAQEIWRGREAPDFPAGSWFPEGRYLKVGLWRVI
jgi:23S rRNA (cytosine1962-C5)-methyltransferase